MTLNDKYRKQLLEFRKFIRVRNYKADEQNFMQPVIELMEWLEQRGITDMKKVDNALMLQYHHYLCNRPNKRRSGTLAPSTINGHIFAIDLFFENLIEQKTLKSKLILPSYKDRITKERQTVSIEEVEELYQACNTKQETALLSVAYGCGLRRKEIHKLDVRDVQFSTGILIVRSGKGSKRREVPMSDRIVRDLKNYILQERPLYLKEHQGLVNALFVNKYGSRTSGDNLNTVIKDLVERTGNSAILDKEITLHCLRHSIATHLSEQGADMLFVRDFL